MACVPLLDARACTMSFAEFVGRGIAETVALDSGVTVGRGAATSLALRPSLGRSIVKRHRTGEKLRRP
jgi:hypothetical protein